jgi:hypothetical protein
VLVLVLDDHHPVSDEQSLAAIGYLAERLPAAARGRGRIARQGFRSLTTGSAIDHATHSAKRKVFHDAGRSTMGNTGSTGRLQRTGSARHVAGRGSTGWRRPVRGRAKRSDDDRRLGNRCRVQRVGRMRHARPEPGSQGGTDQSRDARAAQPHSSCLRRHRDATEWSNAMSRTTTVTDPAELAEDADPRFAAINSEVTGWALSTSPTSTASTLSSDKSKVPRRRTISRSRKRFRACLS